MRCCRSDTAVRRSQTEPRRGLQMNIVLGATGTIGREVVRALRAMNQPVRAVVRDPANAAGRVGEGIEVVAGDLEEPGSLVKAFMGGGVLFLLAPVAPTQAEMELAALRAARVAGVRRVIKLSAIGADPLADGHFSQAHGIVEAALKTSGLGWTIVRGAFFYSNLLFAADTIKGYDQYIGHWGDAPAAWVDPADLAAVCARCMVDPGAAGEILTATGPAALTNAEVCAIFSHVLQRTIAYTNQTPEEYERTLTAQGAPEWYARAEVALGEVVKSGGARDVTGTVARLTTHPPRSIAEYIRAHSAAFTR
jgi:uncharacterized protein YbjT (DUF2867 family)